MNQLGRAVALTTAARPADPPRARTAALARLTVTSSAAYLGACLIVLVAPFEGWQPFIHLSWQSISSVEAAMLAGVGVWAASLVWAREWPRWRSALTWPWVALLAALLVAAIAAPAERVNAIHMVCRGMAAFGVYLLTLNAASAPDRRRRLLAMACVAGTVVAVLAILEYAEVGAVLRALRVFRPGVALVGAQVRAGGSLQYPTIASMYLEIVFAFGLGLLVSLLDARRWAPAAACFAALVLIADGIILTYTRAGLLVLTLCLVLVAAVRLRSWRAGDLTVPALVALLAISAGLFGLTRPSGSVWLRLTTEQQTGWYRAAIHAPADLYLAPAEQRSVPVTLTNTGRVVWDSGAVPPFRISYRWLTAGSDRMLAAEGLRTAFPAPIRPGDTVTVMTRVKAPPQPGRYRVQWDVVQEGILWFSSDPGAIVSRSNAVISGRPTISTHIVTVPLPRVSVRPGRLLLWRTAIRMIAAHPLTGIGLDNYRLLYGAYAHLPDADPRVHSNNMYLEVVVGGGLLAALPLLWLLWRAGGMVVATALAPGTGEAIGVAAAALAIALHGLFDSFLSFTPTYVLIAVTLGLLAADPTTASRQPTAARMKQASDAHRI